MLPLTGSFMLSNRNAYNLVLNRKAPKLYSMVKKAFEENMVSLGKDLVYEAEDEILLPRILEAWSATFFPIITVARCLLYLVRLSLELQS